MNITAASYMRIIDVIFRHFAFRLAGCRRQAYGSAAHARHGREVLGRAGFAPLRAAECRRDSWLAECRPMSAGRMMLVTKMKAAICR